METHFSTNVKLLRKRAGITQQELGDETGLKRATINNYENGVGQPSLDNILSISAHFGISIDTLIKVDLEKLSETQLKELEGGFDVYIRGTRLRVLATTVDQYNKDNIELISHKARAGYTAGYNDPEYIQSLPTFQLPFLEKERKYRMFQIQGDSMLPVPSGAYVLGEYMENWHDVKDGRAYIFLTREEGIVFKVAYNQVRKRKKFLLRSLNKEYTPYEVDVNDVREIWKFVNYTSAEIPKSETSINDLLDRIDALRNETARVLEK
jgi:transcriptional regulator with XRE-family HTH domain